MLSNITPSKQKNTFNLFDWHGLTTGKLLMIAEYMKEQKDYNTLANDCYHEILNFFYETDRKLYDILIKL